MRTIKDEIETDIRDNSLFDEEDDFDCSFMEEDYAEKFYTEDPTVQEEKAEPVSSLFEDVPENISKKKYKVNNMQTVIALIAAAVVLCAAAGFIVIKTGSDNGPYAVPENVEEPAGDSVGAAAGNIPSSEQMQDIIDIISASRLNGMTRRCYLTFDDGPSSVVTGKILDILAEYNVKATFFEVGRYVERYPEITKRVYDEGHLLANHSYSHDYNALYASADSFAGEIRACQTAIENATGAPLAFKLMRFPGGSYNSGDHAAEKQIYKENLKQLGYYFCDWNCINGDAESGSRTKTELVRTFLDTSAQYIAEGKNIVVLMHDTDAKQTTADALELIIRYMSEQSYTFHRLDDITL